MTTFIVVEDYSPEWAEEFRALEVFFRSGLEEMIIGIEHVGSTSVRGLAAKPVIDLDLVIENNSVFPHVVEKLSALGYRHIGNLGISDREAFKPIDQESASKTWRFRHNLYVCPKDSISLRNHITLRDFLRRNPQKAAEYGALKKKLAKEFPQNMSLYVEHKTPFITQILRESGFSDEQLVNIINENKAD